MAQILRDNLLADIVAINVEPKFGTEFHTGTRTPSSSTFTGISFPSYSVYHGWFLHSDLNVWICISLEGLVSMMFQML